MQRSRWMPLAAVLGALVLVVVAIALLRRPQAPDVKEVRRVEAKSVASAPRAPRETFVPQSYMPEVEKPTEPEVEPEPTPEPINYYNGMDPELQPRAYYDFDFAGRKSLPYGYTMEGLVLTDEGLQLAPGEPGEPRSGTLTSAPEAFAFPTNAVAPLWKEKLPAGTDLLVEVQVSPDGEHWGPWQFASIDTDSYGEISPFYPDGAPNPNYGYTPGGLFAWGDLQFNFMRYRITLYSEDENTPTVSSYRSHYQDSSMGEGHIAAVAEVEADIVNYLSPAAAPPEEEIIYNAPYDPDQHLEIEEQMEGTVTNVENP